MENRILLTMVGGEVRFQKAGFSTVNTSPSALTK